MTRTQFLVDGSKGSRIYHHGMWVVRESGAKLVGKNTFEELSAKPYRTGNKFGMLYVRTICNLDTHHEAMVIHVQNDILAHNGQADERDICPESSETRIKLTS